MRCHKLLPTHILLQLLPFTAYRVLYIYIACCIGIHLARVFTILVYSTVYYSSVQDRGFVCVCPDIKGLSRAYTAASQRWGVISSCQLIYTYPSFNFHLLHHIVYYKHWCHSSDQSMVHCIEYALLIDVWFNRTLLCTLGSMWFQCEAYIALAVPSGLKFKFVPDVGLTPHVAP